jgi:adenylosuccinate synthase
VGPLVRQALADNRMVLAEAAQGTLLDLEQGTYPFVTSSCTTAAGVFSGLGIGITPVRRVVGVTKTFQTRVGAGPFPTELTGAEAVALRGTGSNPWDEYGTTTGRPRRVGWLDLPLLRYAVEINGITELFLTKLDVLSGFTEIPVCTAYRVNGRETPELPTSADARALSAVEPVYTSRPGWDADLRPLREYQHFPAAARAYVEFIEKACGVPVRWISVGPERNAVVEKAGK